MKKMGTEGYDHGMRRRQSILNPRPTGVHGTAFACRIWSLLCHRVVLT